jgi:serine protease AprX
VAKIEVLIEIEVEIESALSTSVAAASTFEEAHRQRTRLLPDVEGIEYRPTAKPVPMFATAEGVDGWQMHALTAFASTDSNEDLTSASQVIPAQAEESAIRELQDRPGVRIWPSSAIEFLDVDCRPFAPGVPLTEIQSKLGVSDLWDQGARGGEIVVGILDEGIDGSVYPVAGGFVRAGGQNPGGAAIDSHGSMCAADVLLAAPDAKLYDYPFLVRRSGGALVMLNAVLEQRRLDGTPQVISNSWGFYEVPPREQSPGHEVWDIEHPLHRKIREVVTSGAVVLFAAGNCGEPCPAGKCHESSVGAGRSIHGANSLAEVITVAAVNSAGDRIGYSSQGPGMFEHEKPDVAAYSHFFGNFGPGRPAGDDHNPYDNGASAACPVAAGVAAALLSSAPDLTPGQVRAALIDGASPTGAQWSSDFGHGIVNAAASLASIKASRP